MSENTIGAVLGARNSPQTHRRVSRIFSIATAQGASLGSRYIGVGVTVIAGVQILAGIASSAAQWRIYDDPSAILASWLVLVVAYVASVVSISLLGQRLPLWSYLLYCLALAVVVALDLSAVWHAGDVGGAATSSVSAGFALLVWLTVRQGRAILAAAAVLGLCQLAAILLTVPLSDVEFIPAQLTGLVLTVAPPVIGVFVLRGYRRMVQVELDRVLVQSTTTSPRFAVGMHASEELARLDLNAERLLEGVAGGRTPLPLQAHVASEAASLATELRLHLIEGRRETWLYHAISESVRLGEAVTLRDPGSLAGLLEPQQRDGLLSALWLLVADKPRGRRTAVVTLGPIAGSAAAGRTVMVPVSISTTGVARNAIDPAIWDALRAVGPCRTSIEKASLRVDLQVMVDNPADK
jgi:hypothetical protein